MLLIYHSQGVLSARQAALLHLGLLPAEPPTTEAELTDRYHWLQHEAPPQPGLWCAGQDRRGWRIFALVRASRPDVVHRAFCGIAQICGVKPDEFELQEVKGSSMFWERRAKGLSLLGLHGMARKCQLQAVRSGWHEARQAVSKAGNSS